MIVNRMVGSQKQDRRIPSLSLSHFCNMVLEPDRSKISWLTYSGKGTPSTIPRPLWALSNIHIDELWELVLVIRITGGEETIKRTIARNQLIKGDKTHDWNNHFSTATLGFQFSDSLAMRYLSSFTFGIEGSFMAENSLHLWWATLTH